MEIKSLYTVVPREADAQIVSLSLSQSSFKHLSREIQLILKLDLSHVATDLQPTTSLTVSAAFFVNKDNLVSNKMSARLTLTSSASTTGPARITSVGT